MKLFNFVKGIFGRSAATPVDVEAITDETAVADYSEAGYAEPVEESPVPSVPVARMLAPEPSPEVDANNSEVVIPLTSIIPALPMELQHRVLKNRAEDTNIALPLAQILPQLTHGNVRVTFGEIRQSEPTAFTSGSDRDHVLITLPLGELVHRLGPLLATLRSARKQIEVPDEIVSPFASRGDGLSIGKPQAKQPGTSFTARPRGAQSTAPIPPAADLRPRGNFSVPPPQAPACTPGTAIFAKKATPPAPAHPDANSLPPTGASLPPGRGGGPKAPIGMMPLGGFTRTPEPQAQPQAPANSFNGKSHADHFAAPAPAPATPSANTIVVEFVAVESSLSEEIRLEAGQLNLSHTKLALPQELVAEGLKRGKVIFTWKQIRSWLVPAVPPSISAHDGLSVSLPLAVIAPLFLNRGKEAPGKKRVVVDQQIPNLFFGFPQPEAPAESVTPAAPVSPAPTAPEAPVQRIIPVVPAPKPSETNYFVFDDVSDTAITINPDARPTSASAPGTNFTRRKATPNEVVTKASLLEGVYGALIALPDGLLVAAKLDPAQNGENIAALIPQMYSKLSGCTKELRMGELNNLNFTVGNVPWKIFRVNGIFFAAFGTEGEPLPTAHLTELARELDYKKAQ